MQQRDRVDSPLSPLLLTLLPLLFLGALAGPFGCNQDRAIATKSMNDGLGELKANRTGDAVKLLEEATAQDQTYADPPYYLGQIYHQKYEQLADAERFYAEALKRDPDNAQFMYRYGTVLAGQEKHSEAVAQLREAVKVHPDFPKAWFRLGLSQIATQDYTGAIASLTRSIELDPSLQIGEKADRSGVGYHALGGLYLRFYFYDKALQVYENGVANNPNNDQLYRGKGLAQLKLKRYDDAMNTLEKAVSLDPSDAKGYFNLAIAQKEAGQGKAALGSLEQFLNRGDSTTDAIRLQAASAMRGELRQKLGLE